MVDLSMASPVSHNHMIYPSSTINPSLPTGWSSLQQLLHRLLGLHGHVLLASAMLRQPFLEAFTEQMAEAWTGPGDVTRSGSRVAHRNR